jgi:putative N6-adenine-specific DNA methylase
VHVLWKDEMVTVSIDTSGDSLSKHGYRLHPFKAPLQESLAAAMIFATGWDRKSPFINPMCGSGTLAIEAALMASEIPPGMFRNRYAFMSIKGYDEKVFQDLKDKATVKKSENQLPVIIASDRDRSAIEAARNNAAEAGVADLIRFETCEFDMTSLAEGPAIVIMNPPYGSRLGEIGELEELYSRIGEFLKKKCTGKLGFVLTSEKSLAAKIGLKASRRIPFINADIECRLLQYEMYGGSRKIKKPGEE